MHLQFENPTRGDWASSCSQDLDDLNIKLSLEDIKKMPKNKFSKTIQAAIQKIAFEYLTSRRGSKGQEIEYTELKMAEYLLPNHEKITTEEQRNIFEIRNRMVPIPSNFPKIEKKEICVCGELENSKQIYQCKV